MIKVTRAIRVFKDLLDPLDRKDPLVLTVLMEPLDHKDLPGLTVLMVL